MINTNGIHNNKYHGPGARRRGAGPHRGAARSRAGALRVPREEAVASPGRPRRPRVLEPPSGSSGASSFREAVRAHRGPGPAPSRRCECGSCAEQMKLSRKRQAPEKNYRAGWSRYAKRARPHSAVGCASPYFFGGSNIFIAASPFSGTAVIKLWPNGSQRLAGRWHKGGERGSGRREHGRGGSALALAAASASHKC